MIEVLEQALKAFEVATTPLAKDKQEVLEAVAAIKQAIIAELESQEPAQKPMHPELKRLYKDYFDKQFKEIIDSALYTTPPQRTWVGLTDEEVVRIKLDGRDLEFVSMTALRRFAKDIAQALKEKNQ